MPLLKIENKKNLDFAFHFYEGISIVPFTKRLRFYYCLLLSGFVLEAVILLCIHLLNDGKLPLAALSVNNPTLFSNK